MIKLSIIIINYNTKDLLFSCLDSIHTNYSLQLKAGEYEIIVVDNASKEDISDIPKKYSKVKLIKNKQNFGFSKANNIGIRIAKGDYILLLNPDTLIPSKTLTTMIDFMEENSQTGISTCKVLLQDRELDDACHRGFPTPWRALMHFSGMGKLFPKSILFNGYHLAYRDLDITHEIDACCGAFMLIERSAGEKVGWLDEDYFWYGEDLDFCYRVKQVEYKVMFVPKVSIVHYKGMASGIKKHSQHLSLADKETRLRATRARFDVMRIFYKKHYQGRYPRCLMQLVLMGIDLMEKLTEINL